MLSRIWGAVMSGVVVAAAVASACSSAAQSTSTRASGTARVVVHTTPVSLNGADASQDRVGRFVYAGGVELSADEALRLGGLSDLELVDGRHLVSVTDEGQRFEATLVLDGAGRLSGLTDATLAPLIGLDGRPLEDKSRADAEGIARLPDGSWLVSFEREHRIWRYPAAGGAPVAAPAPAGAEALPLNTGMEALAVLPGTPGTYLVGSEEGRVWRCELAGGCRETTLGRYVPDGYGLPAVGVAPDGATVALIGRAFDAVRGVRVVVRLVGREALDRPGAPVLDELPLLDPLTRDNFEGVALVPGTGGAALRLYLLSDNNYSSAQRTYLFAFDWFPPQ